MNHLVGMTHYPKRLPLTDLTVDQIVFLCTVRDIDLKLLYRCCSHINFDSNVQFQEFYISFHLIYEDHRYERIADNINSTYRHDFRNDDEEVI